MTNRLVVCRPAIILWGITVRNRVVGDRVGGDVEGDSPADLGTAAVACQGGDQVDVDGISG